MIQKAKKKKSVIRLPNRKTTHIVYKNISFGNPVFTEQLFEESESCWNKLLKNSTCFYSMEKSSFIYHDLLNPKQCSNREQY